LTPALKVYIKDLALKRKERIRMCESNVYIEKEGEEILIFKDVDFIQPMGDRIILRDILGEEKVLKNRIKIISFRDYKIILE
jgi:predicted RNA-binding protein